MSTVAASAPSSNQAGKAAWICLGVAWICFLLPIPGLGLFIGWPLNLVAFILAIVAMSKRGAMGGLFQLLASLIASPVVYLIGLAIFGGSIGALTKVAQEAEAEKKARAAASGASVDASATTTAASNPIVIDANALIAAYRADESAANRRFTPEKLQVTGKVKDTEVMPSNTTLVTLADDSTGTILVSGLDVPEVKALKKGQTLTVLCSGIDSARTKPFLHRCSIVK